MYELISPKTIDYLGCWEGNTNQFNEIVGYSYLGHIFLHSTETNEYSVLHPFKRALKNYGEFESLNAFESQILKDEGFIEYVLEPAHLEAVTKFVGPLENEEVYYPCPYPMVGGSCEANTYSKGNVWVFAELVGQTHGI